MNWKHQVESLAALLDQLAFTNKRGKTLRVDAGFEWWQHTAVALRHNAGTVFMIGNGASASMASHFAADLAKNARLHTEVFSDLSLITAISNDMGYDHVFSEPLKRRGRQGDMLVAISSSGKSPNVLAAVKVARQHRMKIVTLTAFKPDNPLRALGDLNAYVPGLRYGESETAHAAILHHWMDVMELRSVSHGPKAR